MFTIRPATSDDAVAVADLIFRSTNAWYEGHGFGKIFQGAAEDCRLFFDVYEDLDPGCCLVAEQADTGHLVGSCFYHPREMHLSLGIMNSDPGLAGKGVAKTLLAHIIEIARAQNKPLRLFSSAMNLDSYSLYTRQGFAPYAVFQDMLIKVPETGLTLPDELVSTVPLSSVRPATEADLPAIAELEARIWGLSRESDWAYFLKNERSLWHVSVCEQQGVLTGVLGSVNHAASNMLGPGLALDAPSAAALVVTELNRYPGQTPVFLVPTVQQEFVQLMYQLGARNCELHFGQSLGPPPEINGIVMPTFMPETA